MKDLCPAHQEALSLSPMIPATISPTQNRREAAAGSPNTRLPKRTVPTVPSPVPTAYAHPRGRCRSAIPRRTTLRIMAAAVPMLGHRRVKPSEYFSLTAQPTSHKPASKRRIQLIPSSRTCPAPFHVHKKSRGQKLRHEDKHIFFPRKGRKFRCSPCHAIFENK